MIGNPKNLTDQLLNLSERIAIEMRALNRTKVSTVNGVVPDADGNVTIEVSGGGGSGDGIPRTGDRGVLAGYSTCHRIVSEADPIEITIDENSPDDMVIEQVGGGITLNIASNSNTAYVKNILLYCNPTDTTVNFGEGAFADTFFKDDYVNDLEISYVNQIVVASYCLDGGGGAVAPFVIVSNKAIM